MVPRTERTKAATDPPRHWTVNSFTRKLPSPRSSPMRIPPVSRLPARLSAPTSLCSIASGRRTIIVGPPQELPQEADLRLGLLRVQFVRLVVLRPGTGVDRDRVER